MPSWKNQHLSGPSTVISVDTAYWNIGHVKFSPLCRRWDVRHANLDHLDAVSWIGDCERTIQQCTSYVYIISRVYVIQFIDISYIFHCGVKRTPRIRTMCNMSPRRSRKYHIKRVWKTLARDIWTNTGIFHCSCGRYCEWYSAYICASGEIWFFHGAAKDSALDSRRWSDGRPGIRCHPSSATKTLLMTVIVPRHHRPAHFVPVKKRRKPLLEICERSLSVVNRTARPSDAFHTLHIKSAPLREKQAAGVPMAVGPGSAAMDLSTTLSSAYRYNQNMMEYYTCKIFTFTCIF